MRSLPSSPMSFPPSPQPPAAGARGFGGGAPPSGRVAIGRTLLRAGRRLRLHLSRVSASQLEEACRACAPAGLHPVIVMKCFCYCSPAPTPLCEGETLANPPSHVQVEQYEPFRYRLTKLRQPVTVTCLEVQNSRPPPW